MEAFVENYIAQNLTLLKALDAGAIARIISEFGKARDMHKRIYAIGNGGSASTASHFVNDMGKGVMLQIKLDFCVALISYKLGCPKGGVHVEEA